MKLLPLLGCVICLSLQAQNSDSIQKHFSFGGYIETYYTYDFNKPRNHERPSFLYNHIRHNEVNVNLALLRANYETDRVKVNLGLMAGTYPQYNLAGEQAMLRNIYEANVDYKLTKKQELWLEAGVFTSHIGAESAIGKDCWTLTRSIMAENSPYYLSGARLHYTTKNQKWYAGLSYLNGWQRIQRAPGNSTPCFGTQLTYKPNKNFSFNSSTFIGNDKPDTVKQMRYFHNFYAIMQFSKRIGVIVDVELGMEQKSKNSSDYNKWYAPGIIVRYSASGKIDIAGRYEYFNDSKGVLIPTGTPNNFQVSNYSLNVDYKPTANMMFRIEGRYFESLDDIFIRNAKATYNDFCLAASIAAWF
ncbi:MAG: porin [Bacteroidia bacterium]